MDVAVVPEGGLRVSYALRGAKDNPEMESFRGRFKTEGHSLFLGARSLAELITVVDERMRYYNTERRHSSIGYVPPLNSVGTVRGSQKT
jgi:transposase InsO family protein